MVDVDVGGDGGGVEGGEGALGDDGELPRGGIAVIVDFVRADWGS